MRNPHTDAQKSTFTRLRHPAIIGSVIDGSKSVWRPGGAPRSFAGHPGGAQGDASAIALLVSSGEGRAHSGNGARGPQPAATYAGATGNGRLRLYLKPQVWLGGGQLAGFVASAGGESLESLVDGSGDREEPRTIVEPRDGDRGGSDPAVEIDGWLVAEATRTLGRWRIEGLTADLTVSASVTASSLRAPGFVEEILTGIAASDLPASDLLIGLPRHAFAGGRDAVRMSVAALRARGVGVAVDDLEAAATRAAVPGVSIGQLIINSSLVASLETDRVRAALVGELALLARLLGAVAVADGVETEAQAIAAHEAGCRLARGPFFGEPRSADEIERALRGALPAS